MGEEGASTGWFIIDRDGRLEQDGMLEDVVGRELANLVGIWYLEALWSRVGRRTKGAVSETHLEILGEYRRQEDSRGHQRDPPGGPVGV